MPLYEYECEGCGEVFEVIQKFSDEPVAVHEKCGGRVHRLISAPSFQFKGTGWYATDYAKGGNGGSKRGDSEKKNDSDSKKSDSDKKASTDSGSKSESKSSESKPSGGEKSKSD